MTDIEVKLLRKFASETNDGVLRGPAFRAADKIEAQAARIADLEAALAQVLTVADELGHHCVGCGHLCGNPERDLKIIKMAGGVSCCPEREIEPLSETLKAAISTLAKGTT